MLDAITPTFGGKPRTDLKPTDEPHVWTDKTGAVYFDDDFQELEPDRQEHVHEPTPAGGGLRVVNASNVRVEPVAFLFPERVPLGALTMLAGDPGLGKSTWTAMLAAGVSTGRWAAAGTVLIANAEDSPGHVVVPRLTAAGADLHRVQFFTVNDPAGERAFTLPGDVSALETHAREAGARLVIVDPLNAHLADDVSSKSDHSVRRALGPLAAMADRLKIACVVVAHLNKASGMDAIYRVGGSIGLVGGARSLLLFTRDPDDPDGEDGNRRALGHAKSNWAKLAPTLLYAHETSTVTANGVTVDTNRLVEAGESDVAGAALLGASGDESPASQHERAVELLADLLGDGERHRSKEVKEAARREGIPDRTLKRAAHETGVIVESEGFPRVTFWTLAPGTEDQDHSGAAPAGPTVGPTEWPHSESRMGMRDSASPTSQSGHTNGNGPTAPRNAIFDDDQEPGR